jgi:hypothetical protein
MLLGRHSSESWNLVPPCLMWTLWCERNRRTFEEEAKTVNQVLDCFATTLFEWSRAWGLTSSLTVMQFFSSLSLNP